MKDNDYETHQTNFSLEHIKIQSDYSKLRILLDFLLTSFEFRLYMCLWTKVKVIQTYITLKGLVIVAIFILGLGCVCLGVFLYHILNI